jgi:hypothetical protein
MSEKRLGGFLERCQGRVGCKAYKKQNYKNILKDMNLLILNFITLCIRNQN